jgi:hypothetical protein
MKFMIRASKFNSDGNLLYRPLHHTEYMVRPIQSGWSQYLFAVECLPALVVVAGLKLDLAPRGINGHARLSTNNPAPNLAEGK